MFWNRCYEPAVIERDSNIKSSLQKIGIEVESFNGSLLWEPMQANMVFTVEPGIYIPEEGFGIRLEDCLYMTTDGPRFFSKQSISIEQPFA